MEEECCQKQVKRSVVIGVRQHASLPNRLDLPIRKSRKKQRHIFKLKMYQSVQNQLFVRKHSFVPSSLIWPQVTTIIQLLRERLFFSHIISKNGHLCNFRLQRYSFFLTYTKKSAIFIKILHYTFTSLRLACSLPLLIACKNFLPIFLYKSNCNHLIINHIRYSLYKFLFTFLYKSPNSQLYNSLIINRIPISLYKLSTFLATRTKRVKFLSLLLRV